jgi:hypothetical protein
MSQNIRNMKSTVYEKSLFLLCAHYEILMSGQRQRASLVTVARRNSGGIQEEFLLNSTTCT